MSEENQAVARTNKLKRLDLPVEELQPNEENPNEMTDAEFNMLYESIEDAGFVDPLYVRKVGKGEYRVIGGHHRLEVAKLLEFEKVPCTVVEDEEFGEDMERFHMVRMNTVRGSLSPTKFMKLYEELTERYQDDVIQQMMGFAEEEEFQKLVKQTGAQLPPEMQESFKEAAKELKTIDELAALLNHLFATYGDTLDYAYMIVDFGGKDSIWLRMSSEQKSTFLKLADKCKNAGKAMDHVMNQLLVQSLAQDDAWLEELLAKCPDVEIGADIEIPTLDFLTDD